MAPPASFRRPSLRSAPQGRKGVRVIAPERVADPSSWRAAARGLGGLLLAAPLALFTAVLLAEGAQEAQATAPTAQAEGQLVEGRFGPCIGGERHTCVVDGDTIWLQGEKLRIADIDAPEIAGPDCEAERATGLRATERLTIWLNAAPFEVHPSPDGRDEDPYGRKLRVLSRGGASAVEVLVADGLATRWGEPQGRWC